MDKIKDADDSLAPIKLMNGTYSTQPRLESLYNSHNVVVLSVRKYDGNHLILETNPGETDIDSDWQPVLWEGGSAVVFTDDGDAVLPVCNQCIRLRIEDPNPTITAEITLK